MKKLVGAVVFLVPFAAYAQQTYTNEDLRKFSVPGAYTNQDLKKMAPLPVVGKAAQPAKRVEEAPAPEEAMAPEASPYQVQLDLLSEERLIYQAELDWRNAEIEKAYSFFDKGPDGYPWPGYRSKSRGSIQYLEMQIAIVDARIEMVEDDARSAGVILEHR